MRTMKFSSCEKTISMEPPVSLSLVIENKASLYSFLSYCHNDFSGDSDRIRFYIDDSLQDNDERLSFIPNLFDLNLNSKKNINGLYKLLKKKYYSELKEGISELKSKAEAIIKEISLDFDVELTAGDAINEDDLFKAMNLGFAEDDSSLLERLIKYMDIIHELQGISVFVIYRLRDYFEDDELTFLRHEVDYKGIVLIDIETEKPIKPQENETVIVMDKDLCFI